MTNQEFIESVRLEGEEWRDVVGWERLYMVSSHGRVLRKYSSSPRADGHNMAVTHPRLLNPTIACRRKQRYYYVTFSTQNKQEKIFVHKIVASAFIPNPLNKPEIDHIDGNGLNNDVRNLRWCTRSENNMNPIARLRQSKSHIGKILPSIRKKVVQLRGNKIVKIYDSLTDAEKDGFTHSCISRACNGLISQHRGYRWMYLSDYENLVSMSKNSSTPGID